MIAARRAFCFFDSAMISPANPPATKNTTLAAQNVITAAHHAEHARQARRLPLGKPTATLSERFLRQSVTKGINGMSHQYADAQNEGRSYNNSR
jgi:hypothetical protein